MKKFARVYIEISNICNLQCDFCPEVERRKKVMSYELFTKIIDEVRPLTEEITFHLMGEPLTHPRFDEFLAYCEKKLVPVNLTTNGTLLGHKDRAERILFSPAIRQVNFSLQSLTANYTPAVARTFMSDVFAFAKRALSERPDLYVNFRLWNVGTDGEGVDQNRFFLEPIREAFGYELKSNVDVAFRKSRHIMGRLYLHFDSRFEWPTLKAAVSSERGSCYGLRSHFAIHADGTVVPCCLDKEAGVALGRVGAHVDTDHTISNHDAESATSLDGLTILQALNSERAQRLREGFARFDVVEPLCQRCTYIRRFDGKVKRQSERAIEKEITPF